MPVILRIRYPSKPEDGPTWMGSPHPEEASSKCTWAWLTYEAVLSFRSSCYLCPTTSSVRRDRQQVCVPAANGLFNLLRGKAGALPNVRRRRFSKCSAISQTMRFVGMCRKAHTSKSHISESDEKQPNGYTGNVHTNTEANMKGWIRHTKRCAHQDIYTYKCIAISYYKYR